MPSNLHSYEATPLNSSSTAAFIIYGSTGIKSKRGLRRPVTDEEHVSFSRPLSGHVPLLYGNDKSCFNFFKTEAAIEARTSVQLVVVDVSTNGDGGRHLPKDRAGVRYVRVAGEPTVSPKSGFGVLIAMWLSTLISKFIQDGCIVLVHCNSGESR